MPISNCSLLTAVRVKSKYLLFVATTLFGFSYFT